MYRSWRSYTLPDLFRRYNSFSKEEIQDMDMYQFGVLDGDSMVELSDMVCSLDFNLNCFHGFDVFTGMPKELAEPIFQEAWDPDIMPDAFNSVKRLNLSTPEDVANYVHQKVSDVFDERKFTTSVNVIPGLVEETIGSCNSYKNAFYVDFDLDIYSPTKYAFSYLVEQGLIVKGTFIGYDDWGGTPHENFEHGESRAHKEISDEYGIKMKKIYEGGQGPPHVQTVWIVEELQK